jgi:queuine tRNA-ribosyltransferase
LPAEQSVKNGIMKFDLLKKTRSPKPEREALLLITVIETPILPVGTVASVKGVHQRELKEDINPDIIGKHIIYIYAHKWRSWRKPVVCINS